MPIMEAGVVTVAAAAAAPYAEIRTGANNPIVIYEMGFFINAATASSIQVVRPAAIGVTPAGTTVPVPVDDSVGAASTVTIATTWGTAPTISTNVPLRKGATPATLGTGIVWTWPVQGLHVPKASSLVIWNYGAAGGSVLNMYVTFME